MLKSPPRVIVAVLAALAALTLTSCSNGETLKRVQEVVWVATSDGDLQCLRSEQYGYRIYGYDCDWSTLTGLHSQTPEDSEVFEVEVVATDAGNVRCLVSRTYGYQKRMYSCDWSTLD